MARMWWVTPILHPNRRLAGPYVSRDECEVACLMHLDREVAAEQLANGKMPVAFVPRLIDVEIRVPHLYTPPAAPPQPAPQLPPQPPTRSVVPPIIYTYTLSELRVLCTALDLDPPSQSLDRREVIEHIEASLAKLGSRKAKPCP